MYTFIYRTIRRHGYADVTIPHRSTSKNLFTLLNFPYIHSHIQSHSPRAPPWPLLPASCGLDLAVNQSASLLAPSFSPVGAITNSHGICEVEYLRNGASYGQSYYGTPIQSNRLFQQQSPP